MTELLARLPDLTDFQAKLPLEEQREILTLAATLHQWLVVPDLQAVKEQIPPAIRSLKEQFLTRCGV